MSDAADALQAATDKVSAMDDEAAKAHAFHDEVIPRWMPTVPPPTGRAWSTRITGPALLLSYAVLYRVIFSRASGADPYPPARGCLLTGAYRMRPYGMGCFPASSSPPTSRHFPYWPRPRPAQ